MIARQEGETTLFLLQEDHAALCGPWARAWKDELPRREETATAAAFHDNGWREWDAAPRVAADGRPVTYRDPPLDDYRDIWRRGFDRAWERGDWVGLFVSRHGTKFLESEDDQPTQTLVARERERQVVAERALGLAWADADEIENTIRFLDGLSLFLCEEWKSPWIARLPLAPERTVRRDGPRVTIAPWPFAVDELQVEVEGLRVAGTRWEGDAELRDALARGEKARVAWTLGEA